MVHGTDAGSPRRILLVVGAGAAGVFAAIQAAEADPQARLIVCEAGNEALRKVRISGGGRCNVTNAETDPRRLVAHYPRGGRELRGPLHRFGSAAMQAWLQDRGVVLKTEADGRVFPASDDSRSIVDCLLAAATAAGVELRYRCPVQRLRPTAAGIEVGLPGGSLMADRVLLATGSARQGWRLAAELGVDCIAPAPSLFTFNIPRPDLHALAGIASPAADIALQVGDERWRRRGPLLVTHWGLSGPAVLWCSAWAARAMQHNNYQATIVIRWLAGFDATIARRWIEEQRQQHGRRGIATTPPVGLPLRLWRWCCAEAGIDSERRWASLDRRQQQALVAACCDMRLPVQGKTTFKDEFVTAGGIALTAIDCRTMALRACPRVHAAGEILDIDGVTGGFNFQAAWTTGWIAGRAMAGEKDPRPASSTT